MLDTLKCGGVSFPPTKFRYFQTSEFRSLRNGKTFSNMIPRFSRAVRRTFLIIERYTAPDLVKLFKVPEIISKVLR